jgi:hypothetical protein
MLLDKDAKGLLFLPEGGASWTDGARDWTGVTKGEVDDKRARFWWYEDGAYDELEIR